MTVSPLRIKGLLRAYVWIWKKIDFFFRKKVVPNRKSTTFFFNVNIFFLHIIFRNFKNFWKTNPKIMIFKISKYVSRFLRFLIFFLCRGKTILQKLWKTFFRQRCNIRRQQSFKCAIENMIYTLSLSKPVVQALLIIQKHVIRFLTLASVICDAYICGCEY